MGVPKRKTSKMRLRTRRAANRWHAAEHGFKHQRDRSIDVFADQRFGDFLSSGHWGEAVEEARSLSTRTPPDLPQR